jgi:endonuclease YncB( thermonuclease family)
MTRGSKVWDLAYSPKIKDALVNTQEKKQTKKKKKKSLYFGRKAHDKLEYRVE